MRLSFCIAYLFNDMQTFILYYNIFYCDLIYYNYDLPYTVETPSDIDPDLPSEEDSKTSLAFLLEKVEGCSVSK